MRLFHVSEEPDIRVFHPRPPARLDLDPNIGLVWAINEERLSNFLTPRNCPRVGYHATEEATTEDRARFFACPETRHGLAIEQEWLGRLRETVLYIYEFAPEGFTLQDAPAGYYVSTKSQIPIGRRRVPDIMGELMERQVELRLVRQLHDIGEAVKSSTLDWSLCRMKFARSK